MIRHPRLTALAIVLAGATAMAYAVTQQDNDALGSPQAKVSVIQAITAAEQHTSGRATRAEYESTRSGWAYDVEVITGSDVLDVRVDANTGAVLSSNKDNSDRDDDHDHKD